MINVVCHKVISVTKKGLILKSRKERIFINFNDCVMNFSLEKGGKIYDCVAIRDITTLSFTFHTNPKTCVVFKNSWLRELITGKSATRQFLDLQKAIVDVGYTSYDLS